MKNEFYDDYAHHPTEIFSVLEGIKKVANNKKITSMPNLTDLAE